MAEFHITIAIKHVCLSGREFISVVCTDYMDYMDYSPQQP